MKAAINMQVCEAWGDVQGDLRAAQSQDENTHGKWLSSLLKGLKI